VDWSERACRKPGGKGPENCPTLKEREVVRKAVSVFEENPDFREFARQASIQEGEGYGSREEGYAKVRPIKPRIVEIVEFAKRMGYSRLGLVFCVGLRKEAAVVQEIFETNGLEVVSVICKAGRVSKEKIGIESGEQVDPSAVETMCNPVVQALLLNKHRTEFNVLVGLCVGHDSMFFKYAEAMCTVLAVKDRLLGHNPLAPVYQYDSYYRYLKHPLD
jgi:uncharacterized metal-binding protein